MIITTAQLCEILEVSERVVSKWVNAGMPVAVRGGDGRGSVSKYDSRDVIVWLRDRAVARATQNRPDDRLKAAQAQMAEIDLAERIGKLVHVDDIEPVWQGAILAARAGLLGLPAQLKAMLDARYSIDVDLLMLEAPVHAALQKLADNPPADEEDGEAKETDEADGDDFLNNHEEI